MQPSKRFTIVSHLRLLSLLLISLLGLSLRAMSLIPPSLDELILRADCIVRTEVLDSHCEWRGEGAQRHIVTVVHVQVDRAIVGTAPEEMNLEFLGGEIEGKGLLVSGQLQFAIGDRDILFVKDNGKTISAVTGMQHGRLWIVANENSKAQFIARSNGAPLTSLSEIGSPLSETPAPRVKTLSEDNLSNALSLESFEASLVSRAAELRKGK